MLLLFVGTEAVGAVRAVTQMNGGGSNDKKKKNLCGACVVLLLWPRGVEQAGKIACHTKTHRVADSPAIQPIVCRVHVTNYNNIVR